MNKWRNILKSATGFWGILPGMAVMLTDLYTPLKAKIFFGACVETFGILAILILYGIRKKLYPKPLKFKLWMIGICVFLFFSNLLIYSQLYTFTHIDCKYSSKEYTVYFPIWPTKKIQKQINKEGTRKLVCMKYGPDSLDAQITQSSLARSTYILLIFYILIFTPIPIAFGFATMIIEKSQKSSPGENSEPEVDNSGKLKDTPNNNPS